MQKIKKALKSLAKLGSKKPVKAPAAKAAKKKVTSASIKKKADSKAKPAAKKAAAPAKKAAPVAKPAAKATAKKSAAPVAKKPVAAASSKKAAPAPAKVDPKAKKVVVAPVVKAAPAKKVEPAKDAKKKAESTEAKPAKETKKKAKAPRGDEDDIPELDDDGSIDDTVPEDLDGAMANDGYAEAESDEVVLTDADGRRYCRVKECDQISMVDGYCRYHYLLLWKKIQVRKKILSEGKLERYIEDLTARYPDKYLEMLRKDLRNEKDFMAAIHELEIDESSNENEFEDEAQSYIEEVRGMSGDTPSRDDDEF